MGGLPPRNAGHASGARPSSTPFTGTCCHAKAVSKRIIVRLHVNLFTADQKWSIQKMHHVMVLPVILFTANQKWSIQNIHHGAACNSVLS